MWRLIRLLLSGWFLFLLAACGPPNPAGGRGSLDLLALDAETGKPIASVRFHLVGQEFSTSWWASGSSARLHVPQDRYTLEADAPGYGFFQYRGLRLEEDRVVRVPLWPLFLPAWGRAPPDVHLTTANTIDQARINYTLKSVLPLRAVTWLAGTDPSFSARTVPGRLRLRPPEQGTLSLTGSEVVGAGWLLFGALDQNGNQLWHEFPSPWRGPPSSSPALGSFRYRTVTWPDRPLSLRWSWSGAATGWKLYRDGALLAWLPAATRAFELRAPGDPLGCYHLLATPGALSPMACPDYLPAARFLPRDPKEGARVPPRPQLSFGLDPPPPHARVVLAVWREGEAVPVAQWEAPNASKATPPTPLVPGYRYYWGAVLAYGREEDPEGERVAVAVDEGAEFGRVVHGPRGFFDVAP